MKTANWQRSLWLMPPLLLVAIVVWQLQVMSDHRQVDRGRAAAKAVAVAQVLDLTTLDSDTVKQKLAAMAQRTTGDFGDQLGAITSTFITLVKKNDIAAEGVVDASGITKADSEEAVVLVASTATVREAGKKPTTRHYRIRVTVEREKGAWRVSGMEFVQ